MYCTVGNLRIKIFCQFVSHHLLYMLNHKEKKVIKVHPVVTSHRVGISPPPPPFPGHLPSSKLNNPLKKTIAHPREKKHKVTSNIISSKTVNRYLKTPLHVAMRLGRTLHTYKKAITSEIETL